MSDLVETLNAIAAGWLDAMARASWHAALAVLVGAGFCLAWRRLPPAGQCWVWRLVYLKCLLVLIWARPVELALLAAPAPETTTRSQPARTATADQRTPHTAATETQAIEAKTIGGETIGLDTINREPVIPDTEPGASTNAVAASATISAEEKDITSAATTRPPSLSAASMLLIVWLVGLVSIAASVVRQAGRSRRLKLDGRPTTDKTVVETCRALCRRFGLRRVPTILEHAELTGLVLVGAWRPVVLIPAGRSDQLDCRRLRLAFAHELAHVKRRDLWWNWLATAVHGLLFFHPLIWLADRRWRLAQESACDELAIRNTHAGCAEYARLLLDLSARPSPLRSSLLAVGVVGSYRTLKRRLLAMKQFTRISRTQWIVLGTTLLLLGVAGIVPWRLVAQEPARSDDVLSKSVADNADGRPASRVNPPHNEGKKATSANTSRQPEQAVREVSIRGQKCWTEPLHRHKLASSRDDLVAEVLVKEDQPVQRGETLVRLDEKELRDAHIARELAGKNLELAAKKVERAEHAEKTVRGTIAQREMQYLKLEVDRAKTALQAAEERLRTISEGTEIRSPIDGVVRRVFKSEGEGVRKGEAVVEVVGTELLRVDGYVTLKEAAEVKQGDMVTVRFAPQIAQQIPAAARNKQFPGRVEGVSFTVERVNHLVRFWTVVKNEDRLLRPSMKVEVTIHPSSKPTGATKPKR